MSASVRFPGPRFTMPFLENDPITPEERARIEREIAELQEQRRINPEARATLSGPRGPYANRQTGRKLQRAGGGT